MGITIPERTKLKGQTPAQLLNGHHIRSSGGEVKAPDEWIKVLALSSMQVLRSKGFALMVEGYMLYYFCWLSSTADEPEQAARWAATWHGHAQTEEEGFLPADA